MIFMGVLLQILFSRRADRHFLLQKCNMPYILTLSGVDMRAGQHFSISRKLFQNDYFSYIGGPRRCDGKMPSVESEDLALKTQYHRNGYELVVTSVGERFYFGVA
ncbi:hypothetical protein AVEN_55002-1 [Araneus ventricosus]|uniref:Uncharacterized protein n=1 Tax=Araneus ventricosus TaxID=182803 RepID=A0A4Y2K019_ARAVE|nr:hypothetical protein AVEN_55002-1 [Araneus ventricosus]